MMIAQSNSTRITFWLAVLLAFAAVEAWGQTDSNIWMPNPYLFVDGYLIDQGENLTRQVNQPARLPDPIVSGRSGKGDNNWQPYVTVLRDLETQRFRMWYDVPSEKRGQPGEGKSHLAYMESEDGIRWMPPHRVLEDPSPINFGASVIDDGPGYSDASRRFKLVYCFWKKRDRPPSLQVPRANGSADAYRAQRQIQGFRALEEFKGGLYVAASPDGLSWTKLGPGLVLPHNHDINSIHWDPIRGRYIALVSMVVTDEAWGGARRVPFQSVSEDLIHWQKPWLIIKSEPEETGETQFYCMSGLLTRGDLMIGVVKVLRDDLNAELGKTALEMGDDKRKAAGVGYTVLAWTRDGETWERDVEPFLDRSPNPDAWDRAHVWADCQLLVDDEVFIYYGGYKRGHKVARFTERQIGLARMKRDRYVSRDAGLLEGQLRTIVGVLAADSMTVNARVDDALRIRVLDEVGKPYAGFDWNDFQMIKSADAIDLPARWKNPLTSLAGKVVRFEFSLQSTKLYSFNLVHHDGSP